jgi:hypothetical protein
MHQFGAGLLATLACGLGMNLAHVAAAQVSVMYAPGKPQVEFACGDSGRVESAGRGADS